MFGAKCRKNYAGGGRGNTRATNVPFSVEASGVRRMLNVDEIFFGTDLLDEKVHF